MSDFKPEKFGKYMLLKKIASGGMAEIYLARYTGAENVSKFVAIKRILPQFSKNNDFIDMFKEEAKIAINLNHANVVPIFEFGEQKGQFYLGMQFVDGKNLRQLLNTLKKIKKHLTISQCVYIIKEVARGLDYAHRCVDGTTGVALNITHRDISPQNIMLSFDGEIKIVDFGIAKAENKLDTTRAGTLKGKFGYMSPEQADGMEVDFRTDIFSLGIVLWEILANDRLFVSNNEVNTLRKIRDCQVPSLRKIDPNIPEELERIANKALTRDRTLRYQSASEIAKDLSIFLNKHYPEFSAQDISETLQKVYIKDIEENRREMIEFAQIKFPKDDGKTSVSDDTNTITATSSMNSKFKTNPIAKTDQRGFELAFDRDDLIIKSKKTSSRYGTQVGVRKPGSFNTHPNFRTRSHNTGTSFTYSSIQKRRRSMRFYKALGILALVFVGYQFYNSTYGRILRANITNIIKEKTNILADKISEKKTDGASKSDKSYFNMVVNSIPSNANIYVDKVFTRASTPAQIQVPPNREFTLTLKKGGYNTLNKKMVVTKQGDEFKANLIATKSAFLNIRVSNGPATIYINGKLVDQKQLTKVPVPANTKVQVQAYFQKSDYYDEKLLHLRPKQKRTIYLKPNFKRSPSSN